MFVTNATGLRVSFEAKIQDNTVRSTVGLCRGKKATRGGWVTAPVTPQVNVSSLEDNAEYILEQPEVYTTLYLENIKSGERSRIS